MTGRDLGDQLSPLEAKIVLEAVEKTPPGEKHPHRARSCPPELQQSAVLLCYYL